MTAPFTADTYACLDVPPQVGDRVMTIRRAQQDPHGEALPPEITVAGSSGVGEFEADQDPADAFAVLDAIAAATAPIVARFGPVLRFPDTDIFVFTLQDEAPFRALHGRIAASGIRFRPSPFPFTPHCTLRGRSPVTNAESAALLALRLADSFILDTLSIYMMDRLPVTLLHRARLRGTADR